MPVQDSTRGDSTQRCADLKLPGQVRVTLITADTYTFTDKTKRKRRRCSPSNSTCGVEMARISASRHFALTSLQERASCVSHSAALPSDPLFFSLGYPPQRGAPARSRRPLGPPDLDTVVESTEEGWHGRGPNRCEQCGPRHTRVTRIVPPSFCSAHHTQPRARTH